MLLLLELSSCPSLLNNEPLHGPPILFQGGAVLTLVFRLGLEAAYGFKFRVKAFDAFCHAVDYYLGTATLW